jgi:hypothetical protein
MKDFKTWMAEIVALVGDDLPEWSYRKSYDEGMSVETAAHFVHLQQVYRHRLVTKYGFRKFNRKDEQT